MGCDREKDNMMFGLFKKKSEKDQLQETYAKMMADAHKLSHSNRTAADKLMAEAEEVAKKIDALNAK
jgi:predicted ATP-dependent protease